MNRVKTATINRFLDAVTRLFKMRLQVEKKKVEKVGRVEKVERPPANSLQLLQPFTTNKILPL